MLSTNELGQIAEVIGPATTSGMISELVSTILAIVIPVLLALWRRSASKSKIQTAVIDVLVRGIEKSGEKIGDTETVFVKRAVREEAQKAGIEQHVEKAVVKVTTKMVEENDKPIVNS